MGIGWRDSPGSLIALLRRHGLDPERVDDVGSAWLAFRDFLAQPLTGLEPDADADGFIVQWGRYSWHDRLPSLTFTRQLLVAAREPELWQVSLDLVFPAAPAPDVLDRHSGRSTDWHFAPPGPGRDSAVAAADAELRRQPTPRALWSTVPLRSAVTLTRAD